MHPRPMKQYKLKLPMRAYVLVITDLGGQVGLFPLTDKVPRLFNTRKEAEEHQMCHERIVRVHIKAQ